MGWVRAHAFDGGLYWADHNDAPAIHASSRKAKAAAQIVPMDRAVDTVRQERLEWWPSASQPRRCCLTSSSSIAQSGSEVSRNVVLVNAAVPGKLSQNWVSEGRLWTNMLTQVSLARLSAYQSPGDLDQTGSFKPFEVWRISSAHVLAYEADLKVILCRSKKYFPNLRLAYFDASLLLGLSRRKALDLPRALRL